MRTILLVKAYQPLRDHIDSPPLGLLYLVTALRRRFGEEVNVVVWDLKLHHRSPEWLVENLADLNPDVIGVSALNCETEASHRIASLVKAQRPDTLVVLGGPYAHRRGREILDTTDFDWVFAGEADNGFPEALDRYFNGQDLGTDIPGLAYKNGDESYVSETTDAIKDLDALGMPAWELIDFDAYAKRNNMMTMLKGKRYATLFTSRGCPFLCNYCHDIFGKRFISRSAEHVLAEIELLYERYGVDEFEIVDDIFNLHKPRLKKIMAEVQVRWPGKLHFCFPNGVRADIMDESVVEAMHQGGVYALSIAIETVTERLQTLVDKNLDIEKSKKVIEWCDERGMLTRGFFMLGFPTETVEEMQATVEFAVNGPLTTAAFFEVKPQPETPLYDLAKLEAPKALAETIEAELKGENYTHFGAWYERAYGFDLGHFIQVAHRRFYLSPKRVWKVLTRAPLSSLARGLVLVARWSRPRALIRGHQPGALIPENAVIGSRVG